jgi:hypothetical protein
MTVDGDVVAGFPAADRVEKVRAAGDATMTGGRRCERLRTVELSAEEARPQLREWPTQVPTEVMFMKRPGLVTDGQPDEFEGLAGRCAVFRLELLGAE